jgi:putative transposase
MPRKPRFNLPGIPQHVIQRGNNREPCFFSDADYRRYLDDLAAAAVKYQCQIHAYVLMTNHVHLLVTPLMEYGISQLMQALGRRYVRYVNERYERSGTLWEGRFKSSLIDSDQYLLICMRYIELNPVRARIVEHPGDYPWSSYRANATEQSDELIDEHPVFSALAVRPSLRKHAYRELFRHYLDGETIHQIRENLNRELVLGRAEFKDKIERITHRQTRLGKPGRPSIRVD